MKDVLYAEHLIEKWKNSFVEYLPKVFLAIAIVCIFYFLAKYARRFSVKLNKNIVKRDNQMTKIISNLIFLTLLISGVFIALEVMNLGGLLTKFIAGAGVLGIVAGFALKDIASNGFAGLLVNAQRPFKVGDWVEVNSTFGTIQKIGWVTTSIKTIYGQEVFVPNQLIYSNSFTNYSTFGKRRVVLRTGVSYGDDLNHVKAVALDEVKKINEVIKNDEMDFFFTGIGSSTYDFELRFWIKFTNQTDYLNALSDIIMKVKNRFEDEDICIAYDVTTLDFGVKGGVNLSEKPIKIERDPN